jgi:hypothetical protein
MPLRSTAAANLNQGTGVTIPSYLCQRDCALNTRVVMICLILLVLFLTRRSWYGYRDYYHPPYYGPYPYPYGTYSMYDPYWRMRHFGYGYYGHRRCFW